MTAAPDHTPTFAGLSLAERLDRAAPWLLIPVLVPAFGILGAAIAACVARVIFTVMTVIWCRRHLGVDMSILSVLGRPPAAH